MRVKDSRGNGVQDVLFALEVQGVSGIRAALKASHYVVVFGQIIYNLSFALVAPLQAEDNIYFHQDKQIVARPGLRKRPLNDIAGLATQR